MLTYKRTPSPREVAAATEKRSRSAARARGVRAAPVSGSGAVEELLSRGHGPGPETVPQVDPGYRDLVEAAATTAVPVLGPAVSRPGDAYERDADQVAAAVMHEEEPALPAASRRPAASGASGGGGAPLRDDVRAFMEPRFGADFSGVRVHTDDNAARLSRALSARSFTHGEHIYFSAGRAPGRDATTAHELAHVCQQRDGAHDGPAIRRIVEVRPPGRGEGSAFGRRDELIARLNRQSPAQQYELNGQKIEKKIVDPAGRTHFDQQMAAFIDRREVVPLRLITGDDLVGRQHLLIDSLQEAYLDLDDMLACSDLSFQLNLIHLLVERLHIPNYERRIGTHMDAEFHNAHAAGIEAEAEHLRSVIGDPTLRSWSEEKLPNGTDEFCYLSNEGYKIFHVFRHGGGPLDGAKVRGGELFVIMPDRRRLTIEQLIAARTARAAPRGG